METGFVIFTDACMWKLQRVSGLCLDPHQPPKNDFVYPNCLVITSDVLFSGQGTLRIHSLRLRSKGNDFWHPDEAPPGSTVAPGSDGENRDLGEPGSMAPWNAIPCSWNGSLKQDSYSFQSHQDPCRVVSHTLPAWFASRKTWVYGDSNYCVL